MPKGRQNVPDIKKDGNWFIHLGLPRSYSEPPDRTTDTSTGLMMREHYKYDGSNIPFPPPPRKYLLRDMKNFKSSNDFSEHDNRNTIQMAGEYFGNGNSSRNLGRRFGVPHLAQHTTPGNFLHDDCQTWTSPDGAQTGSTMYHRSYSSIPRIPPVAHRRYPRVYGDARPDDQSDTTTTTWYRPPNVPYNSPLQVLASTQAPYMKANPWKYSYHGETSCYPPYDTLNRKQGTCAF